MSGVGVPGEARALAALDDVEHGARFLGSIPLHAGRDAALLRGWALAATEFGAGLASAAETRARIVECEGGLEQGLFARYTSRPPTVELYPDAIGAAERLVVELGWEEWFPAGSVRAAALAHEAVHHRLHHGARRAALKRALGHTALRVGPWRVLAHVAGAEELAAHAHAQAVCGLGRSPLLLSAAFAATLPPEPASPRSVREKK